MEESLLDLLFAEDLVRYVVNKNITLPNVKTGFTSNFLNKLGPSPFEKAMGLAVVMIIEKNFGEITACFNELVEAEVDGESFVCLATKAATFYFSNGYTPDSFLAYCAILLGVTTYSFCNNMDEILQCATSVIAVVLTSHKLTGQFSERGGWYSLLTVSEKIINTIQPSDVVALADLPDKFQQHY